MEGKPRKTVTLHYNTTTALLELHTTEGEPGVTITLHYNTTTALL